MALYGSGVSVALRLGRYRAEEEAHALLYEPCLCDVDTLTPVNGQRGGTRPPSVRTKTIDSPGADFGGRSAGGYAKKTAVHENLVFAGRL